RHLRVTQQFLRPLDPSGQNITMRRLADSGFKCPCEINWTNVHFGGHRIQREIAVEVLFDVLNHTAHSATGDRLDRRYANRPRLGGMVPSEMYRNHLRKRIDVEAVFGSTVAKRCGNRNCQLLEHRIENGKAGHELRMRIVAVIDLADGSLKNR